MAKNKDPRALREQAKKLIDQAERIENEKAIRAGKVVLRYVETDFAGFELEKFRKEVS